MCVFLCLENTSSKHLGPLFALSELGKGLITYQTGTADLAGLTPGGASGNSLPVDAASVERCQRRRLVAPCSAGINRSSATKQSSTGAPSSPAPTQEPLRGVEPGASETCWLGHLAAPVKHAGSAI